MSPLLQKETLFFKRFLTLLIVLAAVTVSGCLGLLWMRQKIELTAQATRLLEIEIAKENLMRVIMQNSDKMFRAHS